MTDLSRATFRARRPSIYVYLARFIWYPYFWKSQFEENECEAMDYFGYWKAIIFNWLWLEIEIIWKAGYAD